VWDRGKAGKIRNSRLTYCHLGHSVFQTTANRYSHLAVDAKNIVAESLAEKLKRSGINIGANKEKMMKALQ